MNKENEIKKLRAYMQRSFDNDGSQIIHLDKEELKRLGELGITEIVLTKKGTHRRRRKINIKI